MKNWGANINKRHKTIIISVSVTLFSLFSAALYFFSKDNLISAFIFLILPFPIIYLFIIFSNPRIGFISVLYANYFAVGLTRYIPGPLGLSVDALLVLTWVSLLFSQFNTKVEWKKTANFITLVAVIWFGFTLFQLVNPEARSKEAWFYAMRGVSLYIVLTIPLIFILFNRPKDLEFLIKITAWFTILAVLKGMQQKFIGVDHWESIWLRDIGGKTHLLAGGLRVFSFFPDSGTYGGSMGYAAVVYLILGINSENKKQKRFYLFVGFMALFAMFISGTRGALSVPLGGFALYAILSKRVKVLFTALMVLVVIFVIFKFTTIGNSNYEIRRFRGGLDSNNDSYQVRVENRKKFAVYLSTRPFGGGIGSCGNWGLRFTPGSFLAETPPDGWYIQVWAEQGIIGLSYYLFFLFFALGRCSYLVFFKLKNERYKNIAMALCGGMFGVMAASYSSSAMGQMPNLIIIFSGVAFIFMMPKWEADEEAAFDINEKIKISN